MTTENRSCRYEAGMVCFHTGDCPYSSLALCLQQNLYLAHKEIALLKERRNLKHNKVSIKWRDTSFYYKKKSRALEEWVKRQGLSLPTLEELFSKEEVDNERLRNVDEEATRAGGTDTGRVQNGSSSNLSSGQDISKSTA